MWFYRAWSLYFFYIFKHEHSLDIKSITSNLNILLESYSIDIGPQGSHMFYEHVSCTFEFSMLSSEIDYTSNSLIWTAICLSFFANIAVDNCDLLLYWSVGTYYLILF